MTDIERIQIEAALRQLAIADKWLGQVPLDLTRRSFAVIRQNLEAAITESSLTDLVTDDDAGQSILGHPLNDDDLERIFGGTQ